MENNETETIVSLLSAIQEAGGSVIAIKPDMTVTELIGLFAKNNIRFEYTKKHAIKKEDIDDEEITSDEFSEAGKDQILAIVCKDFREGGACYVAWKSAYDGNS